jgi:adenylate kinase
MLIFLGGIHGVGKSSVCRELAPKLRLQHLTAGAIISAGQGRPRAQTKVVKDAPEDQELLLAGLAHLNTPRLLLDGHYCLIVPGEQVQAIELDVFRRLNPNSLVLLTDDVEAIGSRLRSRDGVEQPRYLLEALQVAEVAHAQRVAEALARPLVHVDVRLQHPETVAETIAQQLGTLA